MERIRPASENARAVDQEELSMKPLIVIATTLGVMLSVAVAGSALAGIGTSPGKTVAGSKGR